MIKPKLHIRLFRKSFHSFHFFGVIGYVLGLIVGLVLSYSTGLAIWPTLLCALAGAIVLLGLTYLYKIFTGKEELVYYQHELSILFSCFFILSILDLPVLPYLDITLIGIGIFLCFGRIGCFSVGCCHGRPNKFGVLYSKAHVDAGFTNHYFNVPIFPIQLIESISAAIIVCISTCLVLNQSQSGTVLLVYSIIYGLIRFTLEFFRGDASRPYWFSFSEAQWTTMGIFIVSIILTYYGALPYYSWHLWITIGLFLFMIGWSIFIKFQQSSSYRLLMPKHVKEIATNIDLLDQEGLEDEKIQLVNTSLGINMTKGEILYEGIPANHYSISENKAIKNNWKLNSKSIKELAKLLQTLKHRGMEMKIVNKNEQVFHIIFLHKSQEHALHQTPKHSMSLEY